MNQDFLSQFYDPIVDILAIKHEPNAKNQLQNSSLSILCDSMNNSPISSKEFSIIKSKIDQRISYSSILQSLNINIQFVPSFLQALPDLKVLSQFENQIYCHFVLYSYVGWCLQQDNSPTSKNITSLLKCLINLINSNYSELAQYAFIRLFAYYTTIGDFSQILEVTKSIGEFFERCEKMKSSAFDAMKIFFDKAVAIENGAENENIITLFEITSRIISLHKKEVNYDFVRNIIDNAAHYISTLFPPAIKLFTESSEYLKEQEINIYILLISKAVVEMATAKPTKINIDAADNTPKLIIERSRYSSNVNNCYNDKKTFVDGISSIKPFAIAEPEEISTFIDKEDLTKLEAVVGLIQANQDAGVKLIRDIENKAKSDIRIMTVFIYFTEEASEFIKIPDYTNFFLTSELFKPTVICLEKYNDTRCLNSFRQSILHIIVESGAYAFRDMLETLVTKPFLLNEVLNRCSSLIPKIANHYINTTDLIQTFAREMVFLQNADFDGIKEVEEARISMLIFLSNLFTDTKVEETFISDTYFIETYLSLLFEEPLKKFVLDTLKNYLTSEKISVSINIGVAISNITEIVRMSLPDERSIQLDNDIIIILADALSHRHCLGKMTLLTCASLCLSLSLIEKSESSTELLLNSMRLFAHSSHVFTMNDEQRETLVAAIKIVFGDAPPKTVFNRLMQIISGNNTNFQNYSFMIRQPKIFQVLLQCYQSASQLIDVLDFINHLLDYSQTNILACREGDIDLYILNLLLKNWYKKEALPSVFIDTCFAILQKISVVTSTNTVVQKFESLLCPFEDKFLPDNFSKVLTTLNKIVALSLNAPLSFVPMDEKNIFIKEEKTSLSEGFWLVFWLSVDVASPHYNPILLTATDDKDTLVLQVQLVSNFITFTQRSKKATSSSKIDFEMKVHEWTFFAMKYEVTQDQTKIVAYINSSVAATFEFPPPSSNDVILKFGGVPEEIPEGTPKTLIGGFAVLEDADTEQVFRLNQHGPLQLNRESINYLYKFTPDITPENTLPNLGTVLSERRKVLSIIPAFAVAPMKLRDGTKCIKCIDQIIELVSNILLINETAERDFAAVKGFSIISHILLSYPRKAINYQTYMRFFSLMQMLRTHTLQRSLLADILANINLWIVADKDSFERIIKHWSRILFPAVKAITNLPILFEDLLNMYILYFWEDEECCDKYAQGISGSPRERNDGINIEECRKNMCDVLLISSTICFTDNDFNILMSHILRCKDKKQAEWLILTLRRMTIISPTPLMQLEQLEKIIPQLFTLLDIRSNIATVAVVDMICNLHQKCEIKSSTLENDIEALIYCCNKEIINIETLDALFDEVLPHEKRVLPLLYWFGLNIGKDAVLKLTTIEPDKAYTETSNWCFWPLVASIKYDYASPNVIMFLIRCDYSQWYTICIMAYIISKKLNADFLCIRSIILQDITGCFAADISSSNGEQIVFFFRFIWNYLFHVPSNDRPALEKLFRESPFDVTEEKNHNRQEEVSREIKNPEIFTSAEAIKNFLLEGIQEEDMSYTFGIFTDEDGNWTDSQISCNVINTFFITKYWKCFYIAIFVLSRLVSSNQSLACQLLRTLNITKEIASQYSIAIDYLIFHMKIHKVECSIEHFKTRNIVSNYIEYQNYCAGIFAKDMEDYTKQVVSNLVSFNERVAAIVKQNKRICINSNISLESQSSSLYKQQLRQEESKNLWETEWNYLTAETAPWEKAVPFSNTSERISSLSDNFTMIQTNAMKQKQIIKKHQSQSLLNFAPPVYVPQVTNEPNSFQTEIILYSIKYSYNATFTLLPDKITISGTEGVRHDIALNEIRYLMQRKINHHPTGIEIFTYNGETCLIAFTKVNASEMITRINTNKLIKSPGNPLKVSNNWVNWKISNFDYIMMVNMFAGRSYNCPSMYPIFPWVISDYSSETLDLNDPKIYRDLSNPICAIKETGGTFKRSMLTPEDVYFYLSRIEPFTFLLKKNTRVKTTFSSVKEEYERSKEIMREVIPEFYCFPEMFEGVQLPPWAKTPTEFIQIQRNALESKYVSEHLNDWMDMMFGIRQRDPDSDLPNVFPDSLYEAAWKHSELLNESQKLTIENEKSILGQVPSQVFKNPHQKKGVQTTQTKTAGIKKSTSVQIGFVPIASSFEETQQSVTLKFIESNSSEATVSIKLNSDHSISSEVTKHEQTINDGKSFNAAVILPEERTIFINEYPYVVSENKRIKLLSSKIQCEASSEKHILFVTEDMFITIFDKDSLSEPMKIIPYYGSRASCACISEEFHVAAIASSDGEIVIHCLGSSDRTRLIRLGRCCTKNISIDPTSGFVIAHTLEMIGPKACHFVVMTTINGTFISKVEIFTEFKAMDIVKSQNGVNYIIGAGRNGNLYISSTSMLKFMSISSGPFGTGNIFYSQTLGCLITTSSKGSLTLIPYLLKK